MTGGRLPKDGAYLYLDDFRKKIEHFGLWRKDAAGHSPRVPVEGDLVADLEGVTSIRIESAA